MSPFRPRPLSRDYGKDARSAELAESMASHQRVISEHEGAMLRDIAAETDQKLDQLSEAITRAYFSHVPAAQAVGCFG